MTLLKNNLAATNVHIKPRIFHSAQFSDSWALNLMEGGCVSLSAQDLLQYKINRALDANNHDQNHHLRLPQSSDRTEVLSSKQSLYNIRIMLNSVCPRAMKNVLRLYHTGKGWDTDIWRQSTIIQKQVNGYIKLAFSNFQIKKITGPYMHISNRKGNELKLLSVHLKIKLTNQVEMRKSKILPPTKTCPSAPLRFLSHNTKVVQNRYQRSILIIFKVLLFIFP